MNDAASSLPALEALIRSPLGEVRVWIEPTSEADAQGGLPAVDGELRTSIRLDFVQGPDAARCHDDLSRIADALNAAVRRLAMPGGAALRPTAVARWLSDRVDAGPSWRTPASDLYRDFTHWCDANGIRPISQRAFGDELAQRGFHRAGKSSAGMIYRGGLRIKPGPVALAARPGALSSVAGAPA